LQRRRALAQITLFHPASGKHREIALVIDDVECLRAHVIRDEATLGKLVGQHKPERRMILVLRIAGGFLLAVTEHLNDALFIEWKPQQRANGRAQIERHVRRVETCTPRSHASTPVIAKQESLTNAAFRTATELHRTRGRALRPG